MRLASVNALSLAILDQHASVVPPGVLINTLESIYVHVILILGKRLSDICQQIVQNRDSNSNIEQKSDYNDMLRYDEEVRQKSQFGTTTNERDERKIESGEYMKDTPFSLHGIITTELVRPDEQKETTIICLSALCTVFISQFKKIMTYPSFDKLWLRLLHMFGYFLGATHGFDHSFLQSENIVDSFWKKELASTVQFSRSSFVQLLECMISHKMFHDRTGLFSITKETVAQFSSCPELLNELDLK